MTFAFPDLAKETAQASGPSIQNALADAGLSIGTRRACVPRPSRLPTMVISIAAHVAVILLALHVVVEKEPPLEIQPITVSITPTDAAPVPDNTPPPPLLPTMVAPEAPTITLNEAPSSITIEAPPPTRPKDAATPVAVTPPNFEAAYLRNPAPVYPKLSRRLRETGTVQLRVRVSVDGQPLEIQLAKTSGFLRLDESALAAVRQWRFQPATRASTPVEAWVVVPVEFTLEKAGR